MKFRKDVRAVFEDTAAALISTWVVAAIYFFTTEKGLLAQTLNVRHVAPTAWEDFLIFATLVLKSCAFLAPGALLYGLLDKSRVSSIGTLLWLLSLTLGYSFLISDGHIYQAHGRHLLEALAFASLPEGHQAGGNVWNWALRFGLWTLHGAILSVATVALAQLVGRIQKKVSSAAVWKATALPVFLLSILGVRLTLNPGAGWKTDGMQPRVLAVLPVTFGAHAITQTALNPNTAAGRLEQQLERVYVGAFGYLYRRRPPPETERKTSARGPNVFVILVESLRADVFTPELMPRVTAWSKKGLVRTEHLAGTNLSEAGTFAVMYGANALVYHAVLDSAAPPPLCEALRGEGYQCAYFTGHPTVWWRREEFLGPEAMDIHQRFREGTWSDWDKNSLRRFSALTSESSKRHLGITFLMSTHYEYRYPPEYEKHTPATEPVVGWYTNRGDTDFASLRNRYKNAVGFVDDIVGDALDKIDTTRDIVVFTGDHGEAIGELGRIGHGYDFADHSVHVPFVIAGPGVAPGVLGGISLHEDIAPTILSLVRKTPPQPNDLRLPASRKTTLLSHCAFSQDDAVVVLLSGEHRIVLVLGLLAPTLRLIQFEDTGGNVLPTPELDHAAMKRIVEDFQAALMDAGKPLPE